MTLAHRIVSLSLARTGLAAAMRRAARRECVVLAYHGATSGHGDDSDDVEGKFVLERDFARQLDFIVGHYRPVSLEQFLAAARGGPPLPPRAILVTADDGYENNLRVMAPHLAARGIPAVFFVVTDLIGTGGTVWTNRVEIGWARRGLSRRRSGPGSVGDLKQQLKAMAPAAREAAMARLASPADEELPFGHPFRMMSWDDVRALEAMGMTVASHTRSHNILAHEDEAEARAEMQLSRARLEAELGHRVTALAYPNGDPGYFLPRDRRLAEACGYSVAFACGRRRHRPGQDLFAVPRITISREDGWMPLFEARLAFPYGLRGRVEKAWRWFFRPEEPQPASVTWPRGRVLNPESPRNPRE